MRKSDYWKAVCFKDIFRFWKYCAEADKLYFHKVVRAIRLSSETYF